MKAVLKRLSYANVMSTVAVFMVLGGGAYAAATVGTGQIKNNSVRTQDVRNGNLRGRDLRRNTLGGRQVKESALGRVPNADNLDGRDSSAFVANDNIGIFDGAENPIGASGFTFSVAFCPAGQRVISGGGNVDTNAGGIFLSEATDSRNAWFVFGEDLDGGGGTVQAQALCAPGGGATSAASDRAATVREVRAEGARIAARRK
jgi:hypothetical protein